MLEFDVIEHKYLTILVSNYFFNASTDVKGEKLSVKNVGTVDKLLDLNKNSDFCVMKNKKLSESTLLLFNKGI